MSLYIFIGRNGTNIRIPQIEYVGAPLEPFPLSRRAEPPWSHGPRVQQRGGQRDHIAPRRSHGIITWNRLCLKQCWCRASRPWHRAGVMRPIRETTSIPRDCPMAPPLPSVSRIWAATTEWCHVPRPWETYINFQTHVYICKIKKNNIYFKI